MGDEVEPAPEGPATWRERIRGIGREVKPGGKAWVPALAILGAIVVVAAIGVPTILRIQDQARSVELLSTQLANTESDLSIAKAEAKNLGDSLAAARNSAAQKDADIAAREADLKAREDAVSQREAAVSATEQKIAENSFSGGVYVVGTDVAAGTYRTGQIDSGLCYYAWKAGTDSDSRILDNNVVQEGAATATLREGQVFESSGCGTWTKLG
ncbi:hypothetical protein RR49_01203 [Microbacterium ginsengisoli]|uniref:Uncharacterized protein n=1 Tax=Microbacterium ginsengisoli TaxID=400772 RepID=A0A0F0M0B7_9MICO|nr:hypothetical protein [Microbacterium ginsengisoli]KJL37091.1 hypothetical protein RR49_01203 [Microbacterium ginsengisoli]